MRKFSTRKRAAECIWKALQSLGQPALAEAPILELTPQPDPLAGYSTHRIIVNIFGTRYEITSRVEMRQITKGPAKVIEMPGHPAIEP